MPKKTCNRISHFNETYKDDLKPIEEYPDEQKDFDEALANINTAAQIQDNDSGKPAETAESAKEKMATIITKFSLRGVVKANRAKNTTLANQLDHPITYLSKAPKTVAILRAKDLVGFMSSNLTTLTNITANDVKTMKDAIKAYDDIKDTAIEDRQHKAAAGTSPLPGYFTTALTAADNMYDLLRSYFGDVPEKVFLINEFALAKQIIITGVHHTGITGDLTINGEP